MPNPYQGSGRKMRKRNYDSTCQKSMHLLQKVNCRLLLFIVHLHHKALYEFAAGAVLCPVSLLVNIIDL